MSFQPRIIVHLGASHLEEQFHAESLEYVIKAVETGAKAAHEGKHAEDIVAEVVSVLENCPVSDAGIGSVYNKDGKHQMDAGIMTGDKRYGAVVSVHNIQNPIKAARLMVDDENFSILTAEGAMDFIKDHGFEILPDDAFKTRYNTYLHDKCSIGAGMFTTPPGSEHGTVGCAVRDIYGNIAAGTSTGGTPGAPNGRVGDSPFPGCGVWADDADGAVSCTGYGEKILVELLANRAASRLNKMPAMKAAAEAIRAFHKSEKCLAGLIMVDKKTGEYGLCHNTTHMPFAMLMDDGSIKSGLAVHDTPV